MLIELKILNFAILKDLEIRFKKGFNVVTGESGAGKSTLIEALLFVMGERVNTSRINSQETVMVQGVFSLENFQPEILSLLKEKEILEEDSPEIILTRKITPSGRNVYRINQETVTHGLYAQVGQELMDIHGQRDHLLLTDRHHQREFLDLMGGREAEELLKEITRLHRAFKEVQKEIDSLKSRERERNRQIEWFRYQLEEIESAKLVPTEVEELEIEKKILDNAEKIVDFSTIIYESLSGEGGAVDRINRVSADLCRWVQIDPSMESRLIELNSLLEGLQDIASHCREKGESAEYNQDRLNEINQRLHFIEGLQRKYGATIGDILEYGENIRLKLEKLQGTGDKLLFLEHDLEMLRESWIAESLKLRQIRKRTAMLLEKQVQKELADLGMQDALFRVEITPIEEKKSEETAKTGDKKSGGEKPADNGKTPLADITPTPTGLDRVDYMLRANPGLPIRPLRDVASGGEISRIMLALKNIFSVFRGFSTLVMDEIDVGLGGITAGAVAEKLKEISRNRQVLSITHIPLVAARGDVHHRIRKTVVNGVTQTAYEIIEGENRIEELNRMMAGDLVSEESRQVAQMLLDIH